MNYIEYVNQLVRQKVTESGRLVVYGQNVSAGSCVSGLARGLKTTADCTVINTPNSENTLVGMGFGLLLRDVSSIFIMKQQDFLLLGIDQLVNTYNILRRMDLRGSFTILPVIVDSGYEGPQSCLNNFYDFCSISRIPGYTITNRHDAESVIDKHLVSPGVRIIGVSQRLFRSEVITCEGVTSAHENGDIHQYADGDQATIVGFNFAFPQALSIWRASKERGIDGSLFSVNGVIPASWEPIVRSVRASKRLVVVDDSKSVNRSSDRFQLAVRTECPSVRIHVVTREFSDTWYKPNPDRLDIHAENIAEILH